MDPQKPEPLWSKALGWIAVIAVGTAFVLQPLSVLFCALFFPHTTIPEIDLAKMWPPVLTILGVKGISVGSNFLHSREQRKTIEAETGKCGNCPAKNCDSCPVKKLSNAAT